MLTETQFMDFATFKPYSCQTIWLIELKSDLICSFYMCQIKALSSLLNEDHVVCLVVWEWLVSLASYWTRYNLYM